MFAFIMHVNVPIFRQCINNRNMIAVNRISGSTLPVLDSRFNCLH